MVDMPNYLNRRGAEDAGNCIIVIPTKRSAWRDPGQVGQIPRLRGYASPLGMTVL